MAEIFPKQGDSADTYIKAADQKLKQIRKLGAKKEQRWFWVGPKKGESKNDRGSKVEKLLSLEKKNHG